MCLWLQLFFFLSELDAPLAVCLNCVSFSVKTFISLVFFNLFCSLSQRRLCGYRICMTLNSIRAHTRLEVSSQGQVCKEISLFLFSLQLLTLYSGCGDRKEKKEGARRESLECMHYVSYPTVKKTALRVGTRAASSAPRWMQRMLMRELHLLEGTYD